MKTVIVGAGAMGCLYAAHLMKVEKAVWLFEKNISRAACIRKNGINIDSSGKSERINVTHITNNAADIGTADLIILLVKSYDTACAMQEVAQLIAAHTIVLTLQNGLGNHEIISEYLQREKTLAGTTSHGANLISDGRIIHAGSGDTIIGALELKGKQGAESVAAFFRKAGLSTLQENEISSIIWGKLIVNIGINPITAISNVKNGQVAANPHLHAVMQQAVVEAAALAERLTISLPYDDPVAKVEAVCCATAENVSSMLQDIRASRRTEIDQITGEVVRRAEACDISTPVNSMLLQLVRAAEDLS